MRLPNGNQAVVDARKLWGYARNPQHPHGSQHARLFKQLLGIDLSNWQELGAALVRAAQVEDATIGNASSDGEKYEIRFSMTGPRGNYNPQCLDHSKWSASSRVGDGMHRVSGIAWTKFKSWN